LVSNNDRDDKNRKSDGGRSPKKGRPKIGRQLFFWAALMGAVLVALSLISKAGGPTEKEVDQARFAEHLENEHVRKIVIKGQDVKAWLKPDTAPYDVMSLSLPSNYISDHLDEWRKSLPPAQAGEKRLVYEQTSGMLPLILANVLPFLLLVGFMVYLVNRQMRATSSKGGGLPFIQNSTKDALKEKPEVTFEDVAGVEEAKAEVQEIVEFLKNPEKFRHIGGRIPRGMLLVGAPGTGKTLLAKAIAGEADVPFFSLCGSDFVELFVGVGASRVRDLFKKARENQPCILFLDEIDAVGRKRGAGLGGGHDEREQTLNAILSEMDGFTRDTGIIVLAATNRPDVLDQALLRPGRFDRQVTVDMPDLKGREAILEVHARKVSLADDVDLRSIARGSPGFSGADLEAVVNEAAIIAAVQGEKKVNTDHLEEARDKVRFGRQKQSRIMSDEDRKMTAYHESGHALVAKLHGGVEPLHKVTILARGAAMGMTMILPEKDKYAIRKKECLGMLTMNMAGRVAEEMFCDDVSSGAKNDIEVATDLARKMVTQWGMSEKLGPISYSDEDEHVFLGSEITQNKRHSERMSQEIDEEVKKLVQSCYQEARRICEKHSEKMHTMAEALLKLETLTADDVDRLFNDESVETLVQEREEERNRKKKESQKKEESVEEERPVAHGEDYPRAAESPA